MATARGGLGVSSGSNLASVRVRAPRMNDLANAETAYATIMLGKPSLQPMMMKKVEWRILARTIVKNLHRAMEKPMIEVSFSCRSDSDLRNGSGNRDGVLLAQKRPLPRKRVTNSTEIVPSAYL